MANKCKCRVTGEEGNSDTFIKIGKHYYKSQEIYDEYQAKLLEVKSGIYKITNVKNNRVYIGESMNIQRRWKEHIDKLNCNQHANYLLQNDFNTFGLDDFKFEVLQYYKSDSVALTKTRLLMFEHKYIKKYEKDGYELYNLEYSLLKILNSDREIFFERGFTPQLLNILACQIATYKIVPNKNMFDLIKRITPVMEYCSLCGIKSVNKSNEKYASFIKFINDNYGNEIEKIIKVSKFKYKSYSEKEIMIEEITDYGKTIFKDVLEKNKFIKQKTSKQLENGQMSYTEFINQISSSLNLENNLFYSVRNWLIKLDIIKQNNNHTYATEFSLKNNYIINNKKFEEKNTGVIYYTMIINNSCKKYVYNIIENMTEDEKKNIFLSDILY
ncbi:MAG TPA: GIY-YIG nuclease family protein [Sedimentibacter sp.]|nr:GIY-YIG nuclease family protein [Sedimentibacter sp.]